MPTHRRAQRLRSADRDVRYATCKELRDASRISSAELKALVRALDDPDFGAEIVSDHGGGWQEDAVPIAKVAAEALARHAQSAEHWALLAKLPLTGGKRDVIEGILQRWKKR